MSTHGGPAADATPIFAGLLEHLRRQGFPIGVDHYLRLHVLLDRLGPDCAPEQLKTLLCPVVATSREQQEQFYASFEQWYPPLAGGADVDRRDDEGAVPRNGPAIHRVERLTAPAPPWRVVAAGSALLALLFATYFAARTPHRPALPPDAAPSPVTASGPGTGTPAPMRARTQVTASAGQSSPAAGAGIPSPEPAPTDGTAERVRTALYWAALSAPCLVFLAAELGRYRRRRLVLHRDRRANPPFDWPIRVPPSQNPYTRAGTSRVAAYAIRRRDVSDTASLDVEGSIAATVVSLGRPVLRYTLDTRAAEYLLLVERAAPRDHQAALFSDLYVALEQEGALVTRYDFRDDPRVGFQEPGKPGLLIGELRRKLPLHRLLVFGIGDGMIDPISGRLRSWVAPLLSWRDRALFTPVPVAEWGAREFALAGHFVVLPASVASLREVSDLFAEPARAGDLLSSGVLDGDTVAPVDVAGDPHQVARSLRQHLGEEAYQWLCACALYPELQWDLTLYLGGLAGQSGSLVTEANLLRLIRLPWFRRGAIPDDVRTVLLADLAPGLATDARRAIVHLLERHPPPLGSAAAAQYQLELAVQRSLLDMRDRKLRRQLRRMVAWTPRREVLRDRVLVGLLERLPSWRGAVVLPSRLRKVFFREGIPAFGWTATSRFATCVVLTAAVGVGWSRARPGVARIAMREAQPTTNGAVPNVDSAGVTGAAVVARNEPSARTPQAGPPSVASGPRVARPAALEQLANPLATTEGTTTLGAGPGPTVLLSAAPAANPLPFGADHPMQLADIAGLVAQQAPPKWLIARVRGTCLAAALTPADERTLLAAGADSGLVATLKVSCVAATAADIDSSGGMVTPAVRALERECARGSAAACDTAAGKYLEGIFAPKSNRRAADLLLQGCAAGDQRACGRAVDLFEASPDTVDQKQGAAVLKLRCEQGDPTSCRWLGTFYERGHGVAKDGEQALALFRLACDGGDAPACAKASAMRGGPPPPKSDPASIAQLNARGQALCTSLTPVLAKFPFNPEAKDEATFAEVNAIFAPGSGTLWALQQEKLAGVLEKQGDKWAPAPASPIALSGPFVAFFSRAAQVSDALYAGAADPHVVFTAQALDRQATLAQGAQVARLAKNAAPAQFVWPSAAGRDARLEVDYNKLVVLGKKATVARGGGEWAMFRVMAQAAKWEGAAGTYRAEWTGGGQGPVALQLTFPSGQPVMRRGWLGGMACAPQVTK